MQSKCSLAAQMLRRLLPLLLLPLQSQLLLAQTPQDQPEGPALSPELAAQSFVISDAMKWEPILAEPQVRQPVMATFDLSGRLWVVQYLQYPEPAGLKAVSHDNFWRVVYDRKPDPPIKRLEGKDKLTVFDMKGERASGGKDFVSGLNIASAVAPDVDGVWVLNPPYLLFYPDTNHDLVPDSPPDVHLDGFGLEDTHSVVNSLCFGPDGWLYAAQGSTVSGAVKQYGSADKPVRSMGQLIWRYHPRLRKYEIFAEGGGNAFGVAFDNQGRIFSGHNGGDTRGFHYEQGGYYRKGFSKHGELSNPFSYGYLMPMLHDPIQRFTHTMLLTSGTQFEALAPDSMWAIDPLHSTVIQTKLIPNGSTYRTEDINIAVKSSDKWFRPVAIVDGPDGAAYVCDWYDSQVAHIYSHEGKIDRDHGRLYRLTSDSSASPWDPALATDTSRNGLSKLIDKLNHPYRWQRWAARRLIANHPLKNELKSRYSTYNEASPPNLEDLWTIHACGWLEDTIEASGNPRDIIPIAPFFKHPDSNVRRWAVRLACDDNTLNEALLPSINAMIDAETNPQALVQLAGSFRRLPSDIAIPLAERLIQRLDIANDPTFTLMTWWLIERYATDHATVVANIVVPNANWQSAKFLTEIAPRLLRRWLDGKTPADMANAAGLLIRVSNLTNDIQTSASPAAIAAFEETYTGRSLAGVPNEVLDALAKLGQPSTSLRLRRGDNSVVAEAIAKIRDNSIPQAQRLQLISVLAEVPNKSAGHLLREIAVDNATAEPIRAATIQALGSYPEVNFVGNLIQQWSNLSKPLKLSVIGVMASRAAWTNVLLKEIDEHRIDAQEVPLEMVRNMRLHSDTAIQSSLNRLFPDTQSMDLTTAQESVNRIVDLVNKTHGNPYDGKKLYVETCGRCHKLFNSGGDIGPDLTGYQRDMTSVLALNIVAPSLEIREGYQAQAIMTTDSEVINGFLTSDTPDQVVLRGTDGQLHVIQRDNIEVMKPQPLSLMPQGLLDKLSEQQICDLFAYLRSSQPLSD